MDISTIVEVGEIISEEYTVKIEDTADFIGNKEVDMLSTPAMIKYMEQTAAGIVFDRLPENHRPVGTKIDIKHINPTPVNKKISVKATIAEIKGSKISFDVEAYNKKDKIGFGTYELHVINLGEFLSKSQ